MTVQILVDLFSEFNNRKNETVSPKTVENIT